MTPYTSPHGEKKKTGKKSAYMDRINYLYEYFDTVAYDDEACWNYLLQLIVKHGFRCPKCGSDDLSLTYSAKSKTLEGRLGKARQHVYCRGHKERISSITKGEAYGCPDTIFAKQQLSLYDFFWITMIVTSSEILEPSRRLDKVISPDGENPTRYEASNKWRKRIVQSLRIDEREKLEGDIQVEKFRISGIPKIDVLYGMKMKGRDDAQGYRYMVFPNEVDKIGRSEANLQEFVDQFVNPDKYQIHTRWKHSAYNFLNDTFDSQFKSDFEDFAEYLVKSYQAFELEIDPKELLKDAAGLYHFSKDNPIQGIIDEEKEPTENDNMVRFNKFVLREYDSILKASKEKWKTRRSAG